MALKSLSAVEVKSADKGEVSAVFSTFNVIDKDGDVTLPGAFTDGEEVVISAYKHASNIGAVLPVGKGRIRTTSSEAILDGQFFLNTVSGREHFEVVKALGSRQEWSYGFDVLHRPESGTFQGRKVNLLKRVRVKEVSPVFEGAGINTRTLSVKAFEEAARAVATMTDYAAAIKPHETPTTIKAWDFLAAPDGLSIDDLRSIHAYVDPNGDPGVKSSYDFLHHHGVGGDANLRACLAGIAALNTTKSAHYTEAERKAIYDHLAGHLEDGDREVPELREPTDIGMKFYEEAADVLSRLTRFRVRTSEVMALRRSKGKTLSPQNIDTLDWIYDEMRSLRTLLDTPQETAAEELARFIALTFEDNTGEPQND